MMTSHRVLGVTAAVLAALGALSGSARPVSRGVIDPNALAHEIEHEDDHVTAVELAEWIRGRKSGLRVIDVRSDSEYAALHVPTAEHKALAELASMKPADNETLVLYSEGGAHAAQGWVLLRSVGFRKVYFLRGGMLDWMSDVMSPSLPDSTGIATSDSTRAHVAALSRYFGGVPHFGKPLFGVDSTASQAVVRMRRRGC